MEELLEKSFILISKKPLWPSEVWQLQIKAKKEDRAIIVLKKKLVKKN